MKDQNHENKKEKKIRVKRKQRKCCDNDNEI